MIVHLQFLGVSLLYGAPPSSSVVIPSHVPSTSESTFESTSSSSGDLEMPVIPPPIPPDAPFLEPSCPPSGASHASHATYVVVPLPASSSGGHAAPSEAGPGNTIVVQPAPVEQCPVHYPVRICPFLVDCVLTHHSYCRDTVRKVSS
jgi:hypothetical protein